MTQGARIDRTAHHDAMGPESPATSSAAPWLKIIALTYLLLLAVGMIGTGFKWAAGDQARSLFEFARDPLTGLMIGVVSTALIQSSSTVSSITVGLVAGGLPVSTAVPIIMGANLGTTVTNTLVSIGHVRNPRQFRRAFAAATVHDFFNLLSVVVFLPLEILFHPFERMAGALATSLVSGGSVSTAGFNLVGMSTAPIVDAQKHLLAGLGDVFGGSLMALLGVGLILLSITSMGQVLKQTLVGRAKAVLHAALGRGPLRGILSGTVITMLVQSSSTTTSLTVPLVGSGAFRVRDLYPFILGANIGTCFTALLAAMGVAGLNQRLALQIALVHLLYNIMGVLVLYGLPVVRDVPLKLADKLADVCARSRVWVFVYVIGVFFALPLLLLTALR